MMLEDVVDKVAYSRPGYSLAAFKEAALPLYVITARVITLEKKPLSPIEEGCLKAVDAGLSCPEDIYTFLGLSKLVLKSILAGLNAKELINYVRQINSSDAHVSLTLKGRQVLSQAIVITPDERLIKLVYDPFTQKVIFVSSYGLFKPKEVKDKGWLEIPLCGLRRPEALDIPLADIDKAIQLMSRGKDEARELLAIRRLERRELQFTPALALYYRAIDGKEAQVAFYREEGFSIGHETIFAELGGPELIGAKHILTIPDNANIESGLLPSASIPSIKEVDELERTIATFESHISKAENTPSLISGDSVKAEEEAKSAKAATEAKNRLSAMTQRPVRCHEHPKLLTDAITKSRERLLIISPWITHQVVNDMFIRSIEALLRNNVDIKIGYGLADEGGFKGADKAKQKDPISLVVKNEFEKLQGRFDNFEFIFIGNTHRKILVSDNRFAVITSFNWLSFKGDPRSTPRDEYGMKLTEQSQIDDVYNDGVDLINKGYKHPSTAKK